MRLLVIDDHVLIREPLRGVLSELESEAVILEATNAHEAMRLVGEHPAFGLVLLDLGLPVTNRTEAVIAVVELGWDLRTSPP